MRAILIGLAMLASTGCAVLEGGLKVGSKVAPDPYRQALVEIERVVSARKTDPVRGHVHRGTWYYQGRIVPAEDIEFESAFVKRVKATELQGIPVEAAADPVDAEREALNQELLEIIRAAKGGAE
jgi:hypothetical protein